MVEFIRDISAVIEVDTNKRMISRTISAGYMGELKTKMAEAIEDIQKELE